MKKTLFVVALVMLMVLAPVTAFAETSQEVVVTAQWSYATISNSPGTWLLNGITGTGLIAVDTVYYSSPLGDTTPPSATVVDGECRFTLDPDGSSVALDVYVNCGNFTGGDTNMANSNTGSNGASTYGAYSWYSGLTYANKVVMKESGSDILKNEHSYSASLLWGAEIESQTGAPAGEDGGTATMTISVQVD